MADTDASAIVRARGTGQRGKRGESRIRGGGFGVGLDGGSTGDTTAGEEGVAVG